MPAGAALGSRTKEVSSLRPVSSCPKAKIFFRLLVASPVRSSPLSNPPMYSPSRVPSPSTTHRAKPLPIPSTQLNQASGPISTAGSPSKGSPTSTIPVDTEQWGTSPSPPLSRSHPLLGSYPLSLLHSRMSHAHRPHCVPSSSSNGFSLHISAEGKGRACPSELKYPPKAIVPFEATYYDLEDEGRTTQTPWVGNVDLEKHYFDTYTNSSSQSRSGSVLRPPLESCDALSPPPSYPGYRVAPVGHLRIIIQNSKAPIKAFLVPYNLTNVPVGGKLLARERTYVQLGSSTSPSPSMSSKGGAREKLRYSFQIQFTCIASSTQTTRPRRRDSSTTRRTGRLLVLEDDAEKEYYLSRCIKVIFTAYAGENGEVSRTERTDEVVVPTEEHLPKKRRSSFTPITISTSSSSNQHHGARRLSGGMSSPRSTEEWEMVRMKWLARRDMQSAQSLEQQGPSSTSGLSPSIGGDTPQTPAALSTTAHSAIFDISPGSRIDPAPVSLLTSRVKSALSPEPTRPISLAPEQVNSDLRSLSPPPRLPFASAQLGVMPNDDRGPATWVLKPKTANTPSRSNSPQPPSVKIPPKNRYQRDASVSRRSGTPGEGDNEARGANDRYHFQEWSERYERELSQTLRRMGVQDREDSEEG